LFVIDPRPYRAAYDSAAAQLAPARARAAEQLAEEEEESRARSLIVAKAISREGFDTRRAGSTQSNADVRAAEAALATGGTQSRLHAGMGL
jgi:membrane fusion protein, multidrug efflux system